MRKLLIVLIVLVVLLVVADYVARDFAEDRIGAELQSAFNLSNPPDASIGGFPFLPQVIAGRLTSISLEANGVRARGVNVSQVELRLEGVEFSFGRILDLNNRRVAVERGTGRAQISEAAITRAARNEGADVTVEFRDGSAFVTSPQLPAAAEAELAIDGSNLLITAPQVGRSIAIELPRIAGDVRYRSIEVGNARATVSFELRRSRLRLGAQVSGNGD